jgi:hypothetical protein
MNPKPSKIVPGQHWTCTDEKKQLAYLQNFVIDEMSPDEDRTGWRMHAGDTLYWVLEDTLLNDPGWVFIK